MKKDTQVSADGSRITRVISSELNSLHSSVTSTNSSKDLLPNIGASSEYEAESVQVSESETRPSKIVILLTLVSSISGFMFGYDTGYISSALVQIGTDLSNKILTSGEKEFITSATSLLSLIHI